MHVKHPAHHINRPEYVSEFTQFIDEFLHQHPEVVEDQDRGWHIFWDHSIPAKELMKADENQVPVKGYYYF